MLNFGSQKDISSKTPPGAGARRLIAGSFWGRSSRVYDYLAAPLMTAGTTLLYLRLAAYAGNQPAPVLFVIPIALSAYLGGLGPGLVSTLTSVAAGCLIAPPTYSF